MISRIYDFFDERKRGGGVNSNESEIRVFTNQSGVTIKARVLAINKGKVTIEREDKEKFSIPLDSLSEEDVKYLKKWWAERNGP